MNFNAILYGCFWFPVVLWANPIQMENNLNSSEEVGTIRYPGTKSCGPGSDAKFYNDLGELEDEDRCCREHDNCDERILSGETLYGLTNIGLFTAVSCKCDDELRNCLKRVNSFASMAIAGLYQLTLPECFTRKTITCADVHKLVGAQFRCSRLEKPVNFWRHTSLTNKTETTPVTITPTNDTLTNHHITPRDDTPVTDILKEKNTNAIEHEHENDQVVSHSLADLPPPEYYPPPPNYYPVPLPHFPWPLPICCVDEWQLQHLNEPI